MTDDEVDIMQEWMKDESGQSMAEYALIIGVLVLAVIVSIGLLSTAIGNLYDKSTDAVVHAVGS